ncbi:MAG TPA: twin-arginine translocation signal domain-containing protein [Actinomycetota bacterium]|nr:twin-arginine translocation signal domain-containing protein [Actinomycetota bacterium]
MSLTLSDVAVLDQEAIEEPAPRRPAAAGLLTDDFNRRQFLRMLGAAGVGAGMAVLGWLPPMRKAWACHTTYTIHNDCAGIDYGACNGCCPSSNCGSDVGSTFCCNGWHRHGTFCPSEHGCYNYEIRHFSCRDKNAWKWTVNDCCNGRRDRRYRCSDGKYRWCPTGGSCGSWFNSVCPDQIDAGQAC